MRHRMHVELTLKFLSGVDDAGVARFGRGTQF